MAHVRKFQMGPRAEYTQQLLNELAAAKLCLLDPNTKASYDAGLQRLQAGPQGTASAAGALQAAAMSQAHSPAGHPSQPLEPTQRDPQKEDEEENAEPLYLRTWFLGFVVGSLALIAGLAVGLGILIPKKRAGESTPAGQAEEASLEESSDWEEIPEEEPVLVNPEAGGEVNLSALTAAIGGGLEFVVRDARNAIGGWTSRDCIAKWRFKVLEAGIYRVEFNYAVTADAAGGSYLLEIDDQSISEDIGMRSGPGVFQTDELFLPIRRKGEHTLVVRTETPTELGLMEVGWIRLSRRQ
jgi:hypothetical protein